MAENRARFKNLITLAVSLAICGAVLEAWARVAHTGQWSMLETAFSEPGIFHARLKPGLDVEFPIADGTKYRVVTNEHGFRGPLVSSIADKPLRLVSIGDSLTFGWGVELDQHAMSLFVDRYQKTHPDRGLAHAFVATPAWDPRDYYYAYVKETLPVRADVVVVGVFGNDTIPKGAPRVLDPEKAPPAEHPQVASKPLLQFPEMMKSLLKSNLALARLLIRLGMKSDNFTLYEKDTAAQADLWDTAFFYLGALKDAVEKNGGRLVILSYPVATQVAFAKELDAAGFDHAMPDKMFAEFCAKKGIAFIPLLDRFEQSPEKDDLYFRRDKHLTAKGHALAAKVLEEKLSPLLDAAGGAP